MYVRSSETLAALRQELLTDPTMQGYAALAQAGNDAGIAQRLNAGGHGPVTLAVISKQDLLLALTPMVARLASKDDSVQRKWDRFLQTLQAVESIRVADARVQMILDAALAEGLILTAAERNQVCQKLGSRAELLFGDGSQIWVEDVSLALNRQHVA